MWIFNCIRSIVAGIAVPAVFILIGAFTMLFLNQGSESWSDHQPLHADADTGRVHILDHGSEIYVQIPIAPGDHSTKLLLTNSSGGVQAKLITHRDGTLVLESAKPGPSQFVFYLEPDGLIGLGVSNNRLVSLRLKARTDGSSEFIVESKKGDPPLRVVRVGPKGAL